MAESRAEFDTIPTRGRYYRLAHEAMQSVRQNEINLMLKKIKALPGERIVDFGTGTGVLAYPLAAAVGPTGVVYAFDTSQEVLGPLLKEAGRGNLRVGIVMHDALSVPGSSVDAVVSLASLHHVPDKGRIFCEFARILKAGGRLVVGDVADGTDVQRYFDGAVDQFCSIGHKHKFLAKQWAAQLCVQSGLTLIEWQIAHVPWVFGSEREACWFLHTLHDATCSPEECLSEAKKYLGYQTVGDGLMLNWQLFYMIATK